MAASYGFPWWRQGWGKHLPWWPARIAKAAQGSAGYRWRGTWWGAGFKPEADRDQEECGCPQVRLLPCIAVRGCWSLPLLLLPQAAQHLALQGDQKIFDRPDAESRGKPGLPCGAIARQLFASYSPAHILCQLCAAATCGRHLVPQIRVTRTLLARLTAIMAKG